jgi:RNA recognition motif-containing protein
MFYFSVFLKGVIYIGSIPRGFGEGQIKKFFKQFGIVKRIRIAKNKKVYFNFFFEIKFMLKKDWK